MTGSEWMALLFWSAAFLVVLTYVGYPLAILGLAWLRPRKAWNTATPETQLPDVLVLLVVHNGERGIAARIENLLACDYPAERLTIVVALDGCTDGTASVTRRFCSDRVQCRAFPNKRGKAAIINEILTAARQEIVVFCDVRQRFDSDAILHLVSNFADSQVGAVSGELHRTSTADSAVNTGMRLYWEYEKLIRKAESRVYSMVGATGAIYALRRQLFVPIPDNTILDDVVIPMQVVSQGYRIVFESRAKAYDGIFTSTAGEFRRKVRTLTGNFQSFVILRSLLNPLRSPVALQFLCHKLLRVVVPFCLIGVFVGSAALAGALFYRAVFLGHLLWYGLALLGRALPEPTAKLGRGRLVLELPAFVSMLNLAALVGAFYFVVGGHSGVWESEPFDGLGGLEARPRDSASLSQRLPGGVSGVDHPAKEPRACSSRADAD